MSKRCTRCKSEKPLAEFYSRKSGARLHYCRRCAVERTTEWRLANLAKHKKSYRDRYRLRRLRVLSYYSSGTNACACCGESTYEFLAIDHINGGGTQEQKRTGKRGATVVDWLIRQGLPEGYRVLCHNCNQSRGVNGYCPHEAAKAVLA